MAAACNHRVEGNNITLYYSCVLYEPCLIIKIVSHLPMDARILRVCKQWTRALHGAVTIRSDDLMRAVQCAYPPSIPTAYYTLMSPKQQISIGPYFVGDKDWTISLIKRQYKMPWGEILKHCKADRELARWALGDALHASTVWSESTIGVFMRHLFMHFEAYRKYILMSSVLFATNITPRDEAYSCGIHDVYVTALKDNISFQVPDCGLQAILDAEIRAVFDSATAQPR